MNITDLSISLQKSIRAKWLIYLFEWTKPVYKSICKRKIKAWQRNREELMKMPVNSLGQKTGNFLTKNEFELEPKLETHDVCHVLLNYDTDVVSEICLQYFLVASGKKSLYAIGTCLLGLVVIPEYADLYFVAYRRGQTAIDFSKWNFEYLLMENTETIRKLIFSIPNENKLYI